MNDKWDMRFLGLAEHVASWSKDTSTKVGAVIAGPDKRIVSLGFNGFPQGMPDDLELYDDRDEKYARIIHGEINALLFAQCAIPDGSTLYTWPFMPCDRCVVQMLQAGLRRFVAPVADSEREARWGRVFERTRRYIRELGGELLEVAVEHSSTTGRHAQGAGRHSCLCPRGHREVQER